MMFSALFTYLIVKNRVEPQGLLVTMIFDSITILSAVGIIAGSMS